jgi:hypothetical protein
MLWDIKAEPATGASRQQLAGSASTGWSPAWEFIDSPGGWCAPELRREWDGLTSDRGHPRQIYQTSAWFDHVAATSSDQRLLVAVKRDPAGHLLGLAPIRVVHEPLEFRVAGRGLGSLWTRNALIMGGLAGVPDDRSILDSLFASFSGALPECDAIRLSCVAMESYLWSYLSTSSFIREHFLLHVVQAVGPAYHILRLPATFDDYLAHYTAKKRYNLKRQLRLLREHGKGRLELRRVEEPEGVQYLLDAEAWVLARPARAPGLFTGRAHRTWRPEEVRDLAERGFLRCYVLECGDDPVGIIKGLQYGRTYTVMNTVYRDDHASFSPGTTTLYLTIDDLMKHRPVETIDFGFGEPRQSIHPSGVMLDMVSVLLLRKSLTNRVRRSCHAAFWSAMRLGRGIRDRI